jgi:DNA-binding transcriptional LysR family regulator
MDAAGYTFRDTHEVGGADERDLLLTVAAGHGIALTTVSTEDVSEVRGKIVRLPLDPPLTMPDTVLASRAGPPRRLRSVVTAAQQAAQQLRQEFDRSPSA